jgi:hypothetical protein
LRVATARPAIARRLLAQVRRPTRPALVGSLQVVHITVVAGRHGPGWVDPFDSGQKRGTGVTKFELSAEAAQRRSSRFGGVGARIPSRTSRPDGQVQVVELGPLPIRTASDPSRAVIGAPESDRAPMRRRESRPTRSRLEAPLPARERRRGEVAAGNFNLSRALSAAHPGGGRRTRSGHGGSGSAGAADKLRVAGGCHDDLASRITEALITWTFSHGVTRSQCQLTAP